MNSKTAKQIRRYVHAGSSGMKPRRRIYQSAKRKWNAVTPQQKSTARTILEETL